MSTAQHAFRTEPGDDAQAEAPLYQRIRAHVREQIERGCYAADGRLPSEPALASQFSTTRMTVRHALRQLEIEGLVLRRPGKGTFVGRGPINAPVVPTRLLSIEEQIGALGSVTYRLLGLSQVEADDAAAARLNVPRGSPLFRVERLRFLDGLVLCIEARLIVGSIGRSITLEALQLHSIHHIIEVLLGVPMARNDVVIRADIASARLASLLEIKRGSPLLVREHRVSGVRWRAYPVWGGHLSRRVSLQLH